MSGYESDREYEIKFSSHARCRLAELKRYIAEVLGEPQAGMNTVNSLIDAADSLRTLPRRRGVIGLTGSGLEVRSIRSGKYVIPYVIQDETVFVLDVLYGKSDTDAKLRQILAEEIVG